MSGVLMIGKCLGVGMSRVWRMGECLRFGGWGDVWELEKVECLGFGEWGDVWGL